MLCCVGQLHIDSTFNGSFSQDKFYNTVLG